MDHFALFNVPRQPWLDLDSLKATFLKLSATHHPDKVPEARRSAANHQFAEINGAYGCLLEPRDRLKHLLELEWGAPPKDVQTIPAGTMELFMEMAQICRETDAYFEQRAEETSPLLKVQVWEAGAVWLEKLDRLREKIDQQREGLFAELKKMNAAWQAAPPPGNPARAAALPLARLEEIYRILGYTTRWLEQIQSRRILLCPA